MVASHQEIRSIKSDIQLIFLIYKPEHIEVVTSYKGFYKLLFFKFIPQQYQIYFFLKEHKQNAQPKNARNVLRQCIDNNC